MLRLVTHDDDAPPAAIEAAAAERAPGVVSGPLDRRADASSMFDEPIRDGQRRALFAAAERLGLSIDDIRAKTPAGSISRLTIGQASRLLDALNAGSSHDRARHPHRRKRRPKGVHAIATPAQWARIEAARLELGWTTKGLSEFLGTRHFRDGRAMNQIRSTVDAREVMLLLDEIARRTATRRAARGPAPAAAPGSECGLGETKLERSEAASRPL